MMTEKQLQELFKDAKTAQDITEIFEANPDLQDEILALGKKKGIDTSEKRELSDLELEMVVGGLDLKKGVMLTLASLMIVSSVSAPLARTTKAHAATFNRQQAPIEQTINQDQSTHKTRAINTKAPLTKESKQTKENSENTAKAVAEKTTEKATNTTTEETKPATENTTEDTAKTTTKNTENTKKYENYALSAKVDSSVKKASDQIEKMSKPGSTNQSVQEKTPAAEKNEYKRAPEEIKAKEYKAPKAKSTTGRKVATTIGSTVVSTAGAYFGVGILADLLGKASAGAIVAGAKGLFDLATLDTSNPNANVEKMIQDNIEITNKNHAEVMNRLNAIEYNLKKAIDDASKKTNAKIDAVPYIQHLKNYHDMVRKLILMFQKNPTALKYILQLNKEGEKYYKANYNSVNRALDLLYSTNPKNNNRTIVDDFAKMASEISGKTTNGSKCCTVGNKSVNVFESNKISVHAEKGYVYDNQSVQERQQYCINVLKQSRVIFDILDYVIKHKISYLEQKFEKTLLERIESAKNNPEIKSISSDISKNTFEKINILLLDGVPDGSESQLGAKALVGTELDQAYSDLARINKAFENIVKACAQEQALIKVVKDHSEIFYNGKCAVQRDRNINVDQEIVVKVGNISAPLHALGAPTVIPQPYYNFISGAYKAGNLNDFRAASLGCRLEFAKYVALLNKSEKSKLPKEESINLSDHEISVALKLIKEQNKGKEQLDGILMGSGDLKPELLETFSRDFAKLITGGLHATYKNVTIQANKGFKIHRTYKYLDKAGTMRTTTVQSNFNFKDGFSYNGSGKNLVRLKVVTDQYRALMQQALSALD